MKYVVLTLICIAVVTTGCGTTKEVQFKDKVVIEKRAIVQTPDGKVEVPSYKIGAYEYDPKEYGFKNYNAEETRAFLAQVKHSYSENDIIAVDNLKWQLRDNMWSPYPNPPMPVYKEGDDRGEHFKKYAHWIDTHPHFGYPPLPMPEKN